MTIDRVATDKLLTTTRSVRKRLDLTREVEPQVIQDCIDIAMQAPTGTNAQNWAFVVITDPAKKKFKIASYSATRSSAMRQATWMITSWCNNKSQTIKRRCR
jgi:nitroreductase